MLANLIVLYSPIMLPNSPESAVQQAVRGLRRLGLGGLAASLLTHGGPLPFLGAQALYAAAPLLSVLEAGSGWNDLAAALEDPQAARTLAGLLAAETDPVGERPTGARPA
jgi:hypothetical protein